MGNTGKQIAQLAAEARWYLESGTSYWDGKPVEPLFICKRTQARWNKSKRAAELLTQFADAAE